MIRGRSSLLVADEKKMKLFAITSSIFVVYLVLMYTIAWLPQRSVGYWEGLFQGAIFGFPSAIVVGLTVAVLGPKLMEKHRHAKKRQGKSPASEDGRF